jgi:phosphoribosylanthranilate isomerase
MSLLVKICGLRHVRDVEAAIASGADAVGFVFADSIRRVSPEQAKTACESVPADVRRVAVMLHPTNDEWSAVRDVFKPDVLQTDFEDFAALDIPDAIERWPVVRDTAGIGDDEIPSMFVYEGRISGIGETVDWNRAAHVATLGRMMLAGGLDAGNVADAVAEVRPFGVDVSSAVESKPGRKDAALIREFVKAARAAETNL